MAPQEKPPQPLTSEESQVLQHLRGLKSAGVELPEGLRSMISTLEQKVTPTTPTISHSTLNRLNRLKTQVGALQKRIATVDAGWINFIRGLLDQANMHSGLYLQSRKELMESYGLKLKEMQELKATISEASQQMCAMPTSGGLSLETSNLAAQIQELQQVAQRTEEQRRLQQIEFLEDDEEEELAEADMEELSPVEDEEET